MSAQCSHNKGITREGKVHTCSLCGTRFKEICSNPIILKPMNWHPSCPAHEGEFCGDCACCDHSDYHGENHGGRKEDHHEGP